MKKLIAILLACILTASLFSGCSWNPFNKEKGPATGPVGEWDIPIPKINPLGSQNLYSSTEYMMEEHSITFVENYQETSRLFYGEMWKLNVTDNSEEPLKFLKKYAKKLGADIYSSPYVDKVVFSFEVDKEKDVIWWGDAKQNDTGYELSVMKEVHALPDKPLTLKPKELGEGVENFSFATKSKGNRFQTVTVTVPSGVVTLKANLYMEKGVLSRKFEYSKELNSIKTTRFVLDDIPQGEGTMIWNMTWEQGNPPEEITFLLQELYDIPEIKMGDELGALKVSGIPFGSARVEVPKGGEVNHADGYSLEGDITPEGDTLFWLPAGYWNVVLEAEDIGIESSMSRLVPVSAGEMTVLKLPNALKSTFSSLYSAYEEVDAASEGIEIFETKDLNDKATISFAVHDPKKRDIFPTDVNTKIVEGGKEVKILDIKRQGIPPSVVLLLDSSGSMKKEMNATIEAAKRFVQGLPENSFIQVVDFDSEARVLNGTTKSEVIKSLGSVKASGSTVLYDSIMKGIEILNGKQRPTLVVFSDGKDSSTDPNDVGSSATKEEVMEAVKEAIIPLYTIGFGPAHDGTTLKELAGVSEGVYYPANDQKALENVFAAINSKFGNLFTITYERPKETAKADTPVVSLVMDNSGSMDTDPKEDEGCGYRIDKVKSLFHDFVLKLPEECLTQMTNFHTGATGATIINIQQLTANKKPELLQALGEMEASNGTPILESIKAAYENIRPVPSNKKVIVYLTDEALEVSEDEQEEFEKLLKRIKEDEIQVIWVGMGVEGKEDVFKHAAELSGGRYVVSEDAKVLESTLGEVLTLINQPKVSEKTPLSISINDKTPAGDVMNYSASSIVDFSKPKTSGKGAVIDKVETATGTKIKQYDKVAAQLIYGTDLPSKDSVITKRMEFNSKSTNKAMELKVNEAYYFGTFKGIKKPDGKQFLAIEMEMKNILQEKIPYQISSFNSQFYVGVNNNGMYPASDATWLAETPITAPGEPMIQIEPGQTIRGAMIFLIPDEIISQESLHYYDTAFGHISIPLIGAMKQNPLTVSKLPTEQPVDITDAFSIKVTGTSVVPKLDVVEAAENTSFRIIDAEFKTKVQALMDIEPSKRLLLSHDTAQGPLLTKMSNVTAAIPFGFMKPIMLAPASNSTVRFAYQIPNILENTKCDIIGDLKDGSLQIPLIKAGVYGTEAGKPKISSDSMDIRINDLVRLGGIKGFGENYVVADITLFDKKDGFGTTGFEDAFALVRDDYNNENSSTDPTAGEKGLGNFGDSSGESEYIINPDTASGDILFGVDDDFAVFDGSSRRGLVIFHVSDENSSYGWTLQSPFFKGLKESIRAGTYGSSGLIVYKTAVPDLNDDFEKQLSEKISLAVSKYNMTKAASGKGGYIKSVGLSTEDGVKNNIPYPSIIFSGAEKISSIKSIEDFNGVMEKLSWLPSKDGQGSFRYSPEAVLTQGWGTEWDLVNLAEGMLSKLGYRPYKRLVQLTAEGKEKLLKLGRISESDLKSIPALAYVDEKGNSQLFVIPFMKDITKLGDLVYMSADQEGFDMTQGKAIVKVAIRAESLEKDAASRFGDIADALGGGDGTDSSYELIEMFSNEIPLATLSIDALDIGYINAGKGKGNIYKVAINTPAGFTIGDGYIDDGKYKVLGMQITVILPGQEELIHQTYLKEGQTLGSLYHTLGINLPDLPKEAAEQLEWAAEKEYKAAADPSTISALRWYSRNILNRFISTQSEYDEKTAKALEVTLGRTSRARSIMVTTSISEKDRKLATSVDIMQGDNEVQSGTKQSQSAYNIGSGLFISQLEGRILPAGVKVELAELWGKAPKGTTFSIITSDDAARSEALEGMKESGYPEILIQHLEEAEKMFIVPDKPTMIDGENRWAWLEIDPITYHTISVLDTGEHSGMAEYVMNIAPTAKECRDYTVGGFIGIETSVWAVAAFSLELDDYNDILKNAMALVEVISEDLDYVMKGIEKPDFSSATVMELSEGPAKFEMKVNTKFKVVGESGNNFDIVTGFKDGAAFYFKNAKKAKK